MSLDEVRAKLATALDDAGRSQDAAKLIAVSKVQPPARVEAVLSAGHRIFGENRVQEAAGKWPDFKERFPGVELHLLGPLQSNKIKPALELFDAIHSLDRMSLAKKLASAVQERGAAPLLFVQVNTGEEEQKSGVAPGEADDFIRTCREMDLPIAGLMAIPPVDETPALHFALLAKIAERNGVEHLSMGMSSDYELAARMGATYVRVGSAIFGERDYG